MRTVRTLIAAATLLLLAACGTNNTLPEPTITSVTPTEVTFGTEVTITGSNYYAVTGAANTRVEVCGVTLSGTIVEPLTRSILLPPGSTITAQVGTTITSSLPEQGITAGRSDVRVTRPDGTSATLENAVTCVIPSEEPDPEPEPEPTPVTAVLTVSTTTAVAPATITFNAEDSTGEGELAYAWDFGIEDATASGAEVTFEYQQAGAYTVTLTVTDETGAAAKATQEVVIHPALQAVIQHSEITSYAPITIDFDATSSTGIAPLTYAWDFGDETGTSTTPEASYEYEEAGTFTVTLTVTDANGETDTAEAELPIPASTPVNAVITADPIIGTAPLTVSFSALNSTGEGDLKYDWHFGVADATSDVAEPEFTFTAGGTYTVSLTVTDETGASDAATQDIAVNVAPASISFTIEPTDLMPDSDVLVTGDNYSRTVSLPDGALSDLAPGSYTVTPQPFERTDMFSGQEVRSTWAAVPQTITVTEGDVQTVALSFAPASGALNFTQAGLPGPWDYSDTITIRALNTPLGIPASTRNLNEVAPGLYELTSTIIPMRTGNQANNTAFITEYEPLEATVQLAVNSGDLTEHEVSYRIVPVGSFSIEDSLGLPAGIQPPVALMDEDLNRVPEPWTDLSPGHYRLEYGSVHYINQGGITLHDDSTVDAYERYTTSQSLFSIYLSSNETVGHSATFFLQDAMLDVEITAPPGQNTADVIITDANGTEHHFTESTNGRAQLYVPIGEYHVEFRDPPGYRSKISGRSPAGWNLVDESYFYENTRSTFLVAVEYEAFSPVPVTISVTPEDLQVDALEVHKTSGHVVAVASGMGTLDAVLLTPGEYVIPLLQSGVSRLLEYEIDGIDHRVTEHYSLTDSTDFTVPDPSTPQAVSVEYQVDVGHAAFSTSGLPGGETPTFSLDRWTGTSWERARDPDLNALNPGVYELTPNPFNVTNAGQSVVYTADAVRFVINSSSEVTVIAFYSPLLQWPLLRQPGTVYHEVIEDVAVDAEGNIYLAGYVSIGNATGGGTDAPRQQDILVLKLDPVGNVIWRQAFGSVTRDSANAIAIDPQSGHLVLAGFTANEALIMKLNPLDGSIDWETQFSFGIFPHAAKDVTVDKDGNIYVTGTLDSYHSNCRSVCGYTFVASYSSDGTERWHEFLATHEMDDGKALALDGAGGLIVAGETSGSFPGYQVEGTQDAFMAKFSTTDGQPIWLRQFGTHAVDYSRDVLVESSGNIIWIGADNSGSDGTYAWTRVRRFDPDGTELQNRSFYDDDFANYHSAHTAALDASGNIILAGTNLGGVFVSSLNFATFATDWSDGVYPATTAIAGLSGIAVTDTGRIVAAGSTHGDVGGPNQGGPGDPIVLIYD